PEAGTDDSAPAPGGCDSAVSGSVDPTPDSGQGASLGAVGRGGDTVEAVLHPVTRRTLLAEQGAHVGQHETAAAHQLNDRLVGDVDALGAPVQGQLLGLTVLHDVVLGSGQDLHRDGRLQSADPLVVDCLQQL